MFQIGDSLREARTRRGLTPADVHKGIRIRERYLTALEEERWDMLPGEAYTKGFLRTYAEFLGLNGNLYIDEYNARIAHRDEEPPLVPETLVPKRTRTFVVRTLMGIIVLGAGVAGLAAWRLGGTSNPPPLPAASANPPAPIAAKTPAPKRHAKPKQTATQSPVAIVSATNGRSWLLVRANGPNGPVLFQGFLELGVTKRFDVTHHVWIRMGRPDQLTVKIAGHVFKPQTANPANLLLTRGGAQPA
ncbi:MAG TPA: helix-turn-helix domain-containing protein [Gaiellaceae bacterium]|nr:helix-turn-helix domain-containing protein [Gaiellaceae bacterium]